ncbi:MAG: hypothetical protein HFI81_01785 [Eubacterium sp.]|jgi:hypothetical protein|nr:hypothetical protein [Eubacterium sp.]
MKRIKQTAAIFGVILLVGLYLATLVFALIDHPKTLELLKISIGFTILIPVLLWICLAMYRYLKERNNQ